MSQLNPAATHAGAFRTRRNFAWPLQQLKSRYGELPRHVLPSRAPATDSAVAPRRPARLATGPLPDPEYEERLEQLAQSMLAKPPQAEPARRVPRPAARAPAAEPAPVRGPERFAPPRRVAIAERDGLGRREPVLDPLPAANAAGDARARPRSRKWTVLAATLVGLVPGLLATWWFVDLDAMDRALSGVVQSTRGLSGTAGEQASGGESSPLALAQPVQDEVSTPVVVNPVPQVVPPQPAQPEARPQQGPQQEVEAVEVAPPPKATARNAVDAPVKNRKASSKAQAGRSAKPSTSSRLAAAKSSKKASVPPKPREDEIDRLRSQAYSESSRDRERKVLPSPKPPNTGSAVAVTPISTAKLEGRLSHKKELAQCERLDGLFYIERCKWRICRDEWGSNGCPSFPQQGVRF